MKNNKRQVNFEVLRVLSMLFVILFHVHYWGTTHCTSAIGITFQNAHPLNVIGFPFVTALSTLGVLCFVLISGYFLCSSTSIKFSSIFRTWSVMWFYSAGLMTMVRIAKGFPLNDYNSLLPFWSEQYWFVDKYLALLCVAPFLSVLIKELSQKSLTIAIIVMSIISTTLTINFPFGKQVFADSPYSLAVFILLYLIAAYIKLYDLPTFISRNSGKIFFAVILFQTLGGVVLNYMHPDSQTIIGSFSTSYNGLSIVPAVALFIWFKNHYFSNNRLTRCFVLVAPYSFAVYLIHENPYIRDFIWNKIIDCAPYWNSPLWIVLAFILPIIIYISCSFIDALRMEIFKVIGINRLTKWIEKSNIEINPN